MNCICIEDKLAIGCFGLNESIAVNYTPAQTGQHVLEYQFLGTIHKIAFDGTIGINMVLPSIFNEARENCFQIRQPDGTLYSTTVSGTTYETFSIYNHVGDWNFPEVESTPALEQAAFREYVDGFTGSVFLPVMNSGVLPDTLTRIGVYRNGQRLYNDHVLIGDAIAFNYAIINSNMLYDITDTETERRFFTGWNSSLLPVVDFPTGGNLVSVYHNGVIQYPTDGSTRDYSLVTGIGIQLNYTPVNGNFMVEWRKNTDDCEQTESVIREYYDNHSSATLVLSNDVSSASTFRVYHNGLLEYQSQGLVTRGWDLDAVNDEIDLTFTPVSADIMVEYKI